MITDDTRFDCTRQSRQSELCPHGIILTKIQPTSHTTWVWITSRNTEAPAKIKINEEQFYT